MPGAGKTTFAKLFISQLLKLPGQGQNIVHLDGDELRRIFNNQDYTYDGRINIAKQYSELALMLANQGLNVVVSTVSLFHQIHAWNRDNIPDYIEIYLAPNSDVLATRNQKNLYDDSHKDFKNIVGKGILPETPLQPNYTFDQQNKSQMLDDVHRLIQQSYGINGDRQETGMTNER
jgi:adenylylsulfate kinase